MGRSVHPFLPALAGVVLAVCSIVPLHGQGLSHAVLEGVVQDSLGRPIFDARAVLREEPNGVERIVTSSRDGRFEFWVLAPGEYSLLAERLGFAPKLITGIRLRPGRPLQLAVVLREGTAAARIDSVRFAGALLAGRGSSLTVSLPSPVGLVYPEEQREFSELARYSALSDAELQMQGLPATMSGVRLNGSPVAQLYGHPGPGSLRSAHLPISLFTDAELTATNPDVEWSGYGAGSLDGVARRGGRNLLVDGFGRWSSDALRFGALGDGAAYQNTQAGLVVGGPVIRDTASFLLGIEASRLAGPLAHRYPDGESAAELLAVARDAHGVDLGRGDASLRTANVVSGFGRFDWRPRDSSSLTLLGHFAVLPSAEADLSYPPATRTGLPFTGRELGAQIGFISRLGTKVAQQLRLEIGALRRAYESADRAGLAARTRILAGGLQLGPGSGDAGTFKQTSLRASEVLFLSARQHQIKFGATVELNGFERVTGPGAEVVYSELSDFAAGRGYLVQSAGGPASASYRLLGGALFVQDIWTPKAGLDVLLGVRAETERLPTEEIQLNQEWRDLTGLENTDIQPSWLRLSPRFGFSWDFANEHRWVLSGSAGSYSASTESQYLGELLTHSGTLSVRRGFGAVGGWPSLSGSGDIPTVGPTLTLLDTDFAAPRTLRTHLEIRRAIGPSTAVYLSGLYRRTDLLARRVDLNLVDSGWLDQNGRAVHGRLMQRGEILFAETSSNRRFPSFDAVNAINQDGWSEYHAVTIGIEHQTDPRSWFVRYTRSETTDNQPDYWGASGDNIAEASGEAASIEGVSDLDVPHRIAAGVQTRLPFLSGMQAAAFYRYQSGYAFTPAFAEGVDANGDGSWRNDPAFVDAALPGMGALLSKWECLTESAGRFAERNSCRSAAIQSLDTRLVLRLGSVGSYTADLTVDGLNLLSSGVDYPDRTLLLVDESRALQWNESTRAVTVPLRVNELFGGPRFRLQPGRVLRLGIQIQH